MMTFAVAGALAAFACGAGSPDPQAPRYEFEAPVPLRTADGTPVDVYDGGYACPSWADLNRDGFKDLLVGQLTTPGTIKVYLGDKDGKLRDDGLLKIGGRVAKVPGIG